MIRFYSLMDFDAGLLDLWYFDKGNDRKNFPKGAVAKDENIPKLSALRFTFIFVINACFDVKMSRLCVR